VSLAAEKKDENQLQKNIIPNLDHFSQNIGKKSLSDTPIERRKYNLIFLNRCGF